MASNKSDMKDEATAAFMRMTGQLFVHGAVSMALAVAKETGIIEALCLADTPLSSTDVAHRRKLKERYVREVLNSLTVAGLVQLEGSTGGKDGVEARYSVPQAHRTVLQKAGISSVAVSLLGRRFTDVKECFALDGPSCIRYMESTFDILDDMGAMNGNNVIAAILKTPGLKERFEKGIKAVEVGCGSARLARNLAAMFPNSHFTITDVVPKPLERARQLAQKQGLTNVTFELLDVCKVPDDWKDKFDWLLACDVIHDLPHPLKALQSINLLLKPGGHFSLVDQFVSSYVAENVDKKMTAALYAFGTFMCIPESYQQPDSEALGPGWGEEKARELLSKADFNVLGLTRLGMGGLGSMAVCMCEKTHAK